MDYNKLEIIDSFGDKVVLEPELGLYETYDFMGNKMPGLGIQFYFDDEGYKEPYATLTVNFGEFLSVKDCAYIDTNNNSFTNQLLSMGFCSDTGLKKQSGFCEYPLWKFDKDFLKAIDVHGLYDAYSRKYDNYIHNGPQLPVYDREGEIVSYVIDALGLTCDIDFDSDGLVVRTNNNVYYREEFYRYLLSEVCEYEEDGKVKGLDVDLCVDFKDLCEHNGVKYSDYSSPKDVEEMEYVITMSSGGGTVRDFMTCSSLKEAQEVCDSYEWCFVDENAFEWGLDIDVREASLETKLANATKRSAQAEFNDNVKEDYLKE